MTLAIGFSPHDSTSSGGVGTSRGTGSSSATSASGTLFPVSQAGPGRLPPDEEAAVVALGNTGAGTPATHEGHSSTDPVPEVQLSASNQKVFDAQWNAAEQAIAQRDTLEKAAALGYVRAAAPAGGIGTHWVLWSQIAKPFDPAVPSMLLFDERRHPAVLVGYSYALQSPARPEGFAGATTVGWSASRRRGRMRAAAPTSPAATSGCSTLGWCRVTTTARDGSRRSTRRCARRSSAPPT